MKDPVTVQARRVLLAPLELQAKLPPAHLDPMANLVLLESSHHLANQALLDLLAQQDRPVHPLLLVCLVHQGRLVQQDPMDHRDQSVLAQLQVHQENQVPRDLLVRPLKDRTDLLVLLVLLVLLAPLALRNHQDRKVVLARSAHLAARALLVNPDPVTALVITVAQDPKDLLEFPDHLECLGMKGHVENLDLKEPKHHRVKSDQLALQEVLEIRDALVILVLRVLSSLRVPQVPLVLPVTLDLLEIRAQTDPKVHLARMDLKAPLVKMEAKVLTERRVPMVLQAKRLPLPKDHLALQDPPDLLALLDQTPLDLRDHLAPLAMKVTKAPVDLLAIAVILVILESLEYQAFLEIPVVL